jgi:LytR cell envelope-related transcriptional attenuator
VAGGPVRAAIVVSGLVAGALVLANGNFGAGGQSIEAPTPSKSTPSPSPTTSVTPSSPKTTTPPPSGHAQGVEIAVFNTTTVTGLAACAADDLHKLGYVPAKLGNAPPGASAATTLLLYRTGQGKADAQRLADTYFKGDAKVQPLKGDKGVPTRVEIAVFLGTKYGATHPGGC